MNHPDPNQTPLDLDALGEKLIQEVERLNGDVNGVLDLLRFLEQYHRKIREDYFLATLPQNRQRLYSLLRSIEAKGGWPYIPRMRLRDLLSYVADLEAAASLETVTPPETIVPSTLDPDAQVTQP